MHEVTISNISRPGSFPLKVSYCESFFCQFKGLMLRKSLPERAGLLLVQRRESRLDSAIHMLFMRFDITAVWIDARCQVVDVQLARRWHASYIPRKPAQYVLETHADYFSEFQIGDQLSIAA